MRKSTKVAMLAGIVLLIWSALFAPTFRYPFHWDDFHLIRPYSRAELFSTLHGKADPDKIETPGLRPVSMLLFDLQGSLFGENVILQRLFMTTLMGGLLGAIGILSLELGLHIFQIGLVFALFVFSRVFASLVLWVSLSHVIFAYIFIVLTAYFFLLWVKQRRAIFLTLMLACATVAVFTREEAYTLPVALPLIWWVSSSNRTHWREVVAAASSVLVIMCFHYWIWHALVPDALSPQFTLPAAKMLLTAIKASWLPGGYTMVGYGDNLIGFLWTGFLIGLVVLFLGLSRPRARWQFVGTCCLGVLLSLPALGVARSFGIAMPTLAFMTAVSIAIHEVYNQIQSAKPFRKWQRYAFVISVILGIAAGIGGGVRRSISVAESLHQNCAMRAERDGEFLFDLYERRATIPEKRRQAGLARLAALGIKSAADVKRLQKDLEENPGQYQRTRQVQKGLFLAKYEYLSF